MQFEVKFKTNRQFVWRDGKAPFGFGYSGFRTDLLWFEK